MRVLELNTNSNTHTLEMQLSSPNNVFRELVHERARVPERDAERGAERDAEREREL